MPTNVSPEYKKAEAEYKQARDPRERLTCLKEMLRTIPKHKGTEHLQADIKTRIKQLSDELTGPRKDGARTGPVHALKPDGAGQVSLIGPPNAGKSSLHVALTGSHSEVAPYPFTTHEPIPGMMAFEDVQFQLVDLPPVSADHMESWFLNALQPADAALLVVDLADPECLEHVVTIQRLLGKRRVTLDERWPFPLEGNDTTPAETAIAEEEEDFDDPFHLHLPTLLVANKCDLDPDPDEVAVLEELLGVSYPAVSVSATTGQGLERIGGLLFRGLGVVRVHSKAPGKEPSFEKPFTVRRGQTVLDVARLVHQDIADNLTFARIWGSGQFDGQQVGADHLVCDGDVLELHHS
jgi:ribosome-interacting GTPase 1